MASIKFELDVDDLLVKLVERLLTFNKDMEDELDAINTVVSCDPIQLARDYVEPDCQNTNPADDTSTVRVEGPVIKAVNMFLNRTPSLQRFGENQLLVLADAGMGKSSLLGMLKLTHLTGFWPTGIKCRLYTLGEDTLDRIGDHGKEARQTVLLLDSLDEDPTALGRMEERLEAILQATRNFQSVIITCRARSLFGVGDASSTKEGHVEIAGRVCRTIYLDCFGDSKIEAYLAKRFPLTFREKIKSWALAQPDFKVEAPKAGGEHIPKLQISPFLLSHIKDLVETHQALKGPYAVYDALVNQWLLREAGELRDRGHGDVTREILLRACETIALHLLHDRQRELHPKVLQTITDKAPELKPIAKVGLSERSLFNLNPDGNYRFAHHSVQEFLGAKLIVRGGLQQPLKCSELLLSFVLAHHLERSQIPYGDFEQRIPLGLIDFEEARLSGVNLSMADLSRVNMSGANLSGATLSRADLSRADLSRACLKGATLSGSNLSRAYLKEANIAEANLSGADLSDADLSKSILSGADLSGADLSGADLSMADAFNANISKTDLSESALSKVNFYKANLSGSNLSMADLSKVNLSGANLSGADLSGATLSCADLSGADLSRICLAGANLIEANLFSADLSGATLSEADFSRASLSGANLSEANLSHSDLSRSDLSQANLSRADIFKANLSGANLSAVNLAGADLSNADLSDSRLKEANLCGSSLCGADLSGANLSGANLSGARYDSKTQWPNGFDFRNSRAIGPHSNLKGVSLSGIDLSGVDLSGANLSGANLSGARYDSKTRWPNGFDFRNSRAIGPHSNLKGVDLSEANLAGVDISRADLSGVNLSGANLSGANLSGANLSRANVLEANLSRTDLTGANLVGANLSRASLSEANLSRTNIKEADLSGADLSKANLCGANLLDANLSEANLFGADLCGADLCGADLSGVRYDSETRWPDRFEIERSIGPSTNLASADLSAAGLSGDDLSRVNLSAAELSGLDLSGANLSRANLSGANLSGAELSEAALDGAVLCGAALSKANLMEANLSSADLTGADLTGADLCGANLCGANLSEAKLKGADLAGARYNEHTRWPEGFDFESRI